ncbi:hypothetical protein KUV85_02485 [Nocardioides panacisoli]|uniref:hypothetical protein n=1 Tax=Nocardioides panacisoli TaxID=627624 RepID=UPI001C632CB0|nr:hypothetical protein [Nocardioides panacisoli]QYJ04564.1 hypothetical protein KUV85_02485 [Nocardioides panacisoli]
MLTIIIAMVLILVVSGLVITYVAFPHRGQDVPRASWLGAAMTRTVARAPVLPAQDDGQRDTAARHLLQR